MRIAFDMSSVLWTSLLAGKDEADGEWVESNGKKKLINSAAFGYENAINLMVSALHEFGATPMQAILVVEGLNSKYPRMCIDKMYKAGESKLPQQYEQFQILRNQIVELWRSLGAIAVSQDNAEGDDVLAWLAQNIKEKLVIVTNDNDLTVLHGTNEGRVAVRVNGVVGHNKYGMFPHKFVTLYKSLVGDPSDKIKGIPGFGEAAWMELDKRFGDKGMQYLTDLLESNNLLQLEEDSEKDKFVKRLFDGREDWLKSYKLAKLHPEWVNTMQNPIQWKPGFVHGRSDDERLRQFGSSRRLITADNWSSFTPWCLKQLEHHPWYALDIETSTPAESDDWLAAQGKPEGVDVIGSRLTGLSLTFGKNMQFTVYISVDHKDTKNVDKALVGQFLNSIDKIAVIQNTTFEGTVLFNEFGESWKDNGNGGLLRAWYDTKFEASYVDENDKLGLKHLSKKWLDYDQVDYASATTLTGPVGSLPVGGKSRGQFQHVVQPAVKSISVGADGSAIEVVDTPEVAETWEKIQYKMNELSAEHVFAYACDDTQTTAGLHNFFKLVMDIEDTWKVYEAVEIDASYLHVKSYIHGFSISVPKLNELVQEDDLASAEAQKVVDAYLISQGWEGSVAPVFAEVDANAIKTAYRIVLGEELKTMVRTPSKLIAMVAEKSPTLAGACGSADDLNKLVAYAFKAAPVLNTGSPKQMQHLFYEVMGLPVRVFNKPTDTMRAQGLKLGSPKTDNLAIAYALKECTEEQAAVLKALQVIKMVQTRHSLYYDTYPHFIHWKTGRVHSEHNQCATNTRRASSSSPNSQQLSKNQKVEGFSPRVREVIVPHKKGAVIVSCDFKSQEILLQAEWSKDPELVALFVGDNPKDMHAITGCKIFNSTHGLELSYEQYVAVLDSPEHELYKKAKAARALGKAVNFASQYRIAAQKLSSMLFVTEEEAQVMLDAKAEAFPVAEEWAQNEMRNVKTTGIVHSMLGAIRHLGPALMSSDYVIAGKAERQTLSYRIQGSAAEMTKLAEGRMWKKRLEERYDAEIIAAIHDEVVASVTIEDSAAFIAEMHECMVQKYANMVLPVKSSISIGPDFGRQFEIGELPTEEAVNEGLAKIKELV